jgi:hypothetical protein
MAKTSGPSIVTWLLIGGAAYVAYEFFFASSSAAATSPTPATPAPASPTPAAPSAATSAPSSPSTLDSYFAAMVQAASAAGFTSGSADQWGYYFQQANGFAAPTPESEGFNRQSNWPSNLTAAQYWAAASPVIAKQKGISGLGVYGSLAGLAGYRGKR